MVDAQEFLSQLKKDLHAQKENPELQVDYFHDFFSLRNKEFKENDDRFEEDYRGWSYKIVKPMFNVEGGPSVDNASIQFSKEGEKDIYVRFSADYYSLFDEMNYDHMIDSARLTTPDEIEKDWYGSLQFMLNC